MGIALEHIYHPDMSCGTTKECRLDMMMKTPCPVHIPTHRLQVWTCQWYNLVKSHIKITITIILKPIVKNPEHNPMSSDSKEMEYGVSNPFGHITVEEICIKTKPKVEEVRCGMVIHDAETLKMNWWRMRNPFI